MIYNKNDQYIDNKRFAAVVRLVITTNQIATVVILMMI